VGGGGGRKAENIGPGIRGLCKSELRGEKRARYGRECRTHASGTLWKEEVCKGEGAVES